MIQLRPSIAIEYILDFQFGPHSLNVSDWAGIFNVFWYQSFDGFQFDPSMQIYYKSLIFSVPKFYFFQFYPSMQLNYEF